MYSKRLSIFLIVSSLYIQNIFSRPLITIHLINLKFILIYLNWIYAMHPVLVKYRGGGALSYLPEAIGSIRLSARAALVRLAC
jgi:hypothetical protein